MKGNKQADPQLSVFVRDHMGQKDMRICQTCRSNQSTKSLFPQQCFSLSFSELTSITHAGDSVTVSVCVSVCVSALNCLLVEEYG